MPQVLATGGAESLVDRSKCEAIVEKHFEEMKADLGIPHWRVNVDFGRCARDDWEAESLVRPEYWRADITINHDLMRDHKHVIYCLRHELLHVVCGPMYVLRDMIDLEEDERTQEKNHRIWTFCIEQMVANLEKGLARDIYYHEEENDEHDDHGTSGVLAPA